MTRPEAKKLLEDAVSRLGEHFCALHFMATWTDCGETHTIGIGAGNFNARRGMVEEFIDTEKARISARELAEVLNADPV